MKEKETLYVVHYIHNTSFDNNIDGRREYFEVVTNDFDKWLEDHNKNREGDGEIIETADEFNVQECNPVIYKPKK